MKKETGIILLVVGLVIGFVAGLITSTAMQPAGGGSQKTSFSQKDTGSLPQDPTESPGSYANSQKAEEKSADKARLMEEIKQLKYSLEKDPNNIDILVSLGNDHFDTEQYYAAVDYYEKALKINPNMPNVLVDLGIMYRAIKKFDKAIEKFDEAIKIDAKHENAHLNKAVVLKYNIGDYKKALEVFKKFITIASSNSPMLESAKKEIASLEDEIKKGNLHPAKGDEKH